MRCKGFIQGKNHYYELNGVKDVQRRLVLLLIIAMMLSLLLLAGCANDKSTSNSKDRSKDELVLAISSEPESGFDPTTVGDVMGHRCFSTLLTRDNNLKIINDLATSYTISEDGLVWTVKLCDNVKFQMANHLRQVTWSTLIRLLLKVVR